MVNDFGDHGDDWVRVRAVAPHGRVLWFAEGPAREVQPLLDAKVWRDQVGSAEEVHLQVHVREDSFVTYLKDRPQR